MRYFPAITFLLAAAAPAAQAQANAPTGQAKARSGAPVAILRSGPDVGRRAPDFTLPWASHDGVGPAESPYQLWSDFGKRTVLVFFAQAFTKTSTTQLQTLAEQYDALFGPDVVVIGISTDTPDAQSRFAAQVGIPFRLVSDAGQKVAKQYGARGTNGRIRPAVYVIGADGTVRYRDLRFDPLKSKSYGALGAAVRRAGKPE